MVSSNHWCTVKWREMTNNGTQDKNKTMRDETLDANEVHGSSQWFGRNTESSDRHWEETTGAAM